MTTYNELKRKHAQELNDFPIIWAFNNAQLQEGMERLEVTEKELLSIGAGGYIRKKDSKSYSNIISRQNNEMNEAMADEEFMVKAIEYEMANHEYCITYDSEEIFGLLNLDPNNETHTNCFLMAETNYLAASCF